MPTALSLSLLGLPLLLHIQSLQNSPTMLFINTRPVDEGIVSDRRASKATSHCSVHSSHPSRVHMTRLVLGLIIFYLLVSAFPCMLMFPLALVCLPVPIILFLYALCKLREDNRSDHWPCIMIAISGILLKIAAVAIFITVFPADEHERRSNAPHLAKHERKETNFNQYRGAFFILLLFIELFLLSAGACFKWHLLAFEKMENEAKQRRLTLSSNRPLLSEAASRRISQ